MVVPEVIRRVENRIKKGQEIIRDIIQELTIPIPEMTIKEGIDYRSTTLNATELQGY